MTEPTELERAIDILRFAATLLSGEPEAAAVFIDASDCLDCGEDVPGLPDLTAAALKTIAALS